MGRVLAVIAALAAAGLLGSIFPDLRRYIKMRRM
jgi:hypothetical protein